MMRRRTEKIAACVAGVLAIATQARAQLPAEIREEGAAPSEGSATVHNCPQLDGSLLSELVELETRRASGQLQSVSVDCLGDSVHVVLRTVQTEERVFELGPQPSPNAGSRLVAAVVGEMFSGPPVEDASPSERERREAIIPEKEPSLALLRGRPSGPPSTAALPVTHESRPRVDSLSDRRDWSVGAFASARWFSEIGFGAFGVGLGGRWSFHRSFELATDVLFERGTDEGAFGQTRFSSVSVGPRLRWFSPVSFGDVGVAVGARLGYARLGVDPGDLGDAGDAFESLWGGPMVAADARWFLSDTFVLEVIAELGWVTGTLVGMDGSTEVARVSGPWLAAAPRLGMRF